MQQTSTVRPVLGASSLNFSEWNIVDKWSSQVWKSGAMLGTSTGRPVDDKYVIDDDMDSDSSTESNLSLKSRSFVNRGMIDCERCWTVLQKMQFWRKFMSSTLETSVFMGKNDSEHVHSIKNTGRDLT